MDAWQWAALLKPLGLLILFGGIVLPIEWAIKKLMPDCRLKRILFFRWTV